jgi:endonuclease/exonuclease/phosphatase family metal-dependent hydrolase
MSYNVQNWLTMERRQGDDSVKELPKPDEEKKQVVQLIAAHKPDVIGLLEIGTAEDLAEIQERLKVTGWPMPFLYYTGGSDPVRHQGILSRYRILETVKPKETQFQIRGASYEMNRGILDATIEGGGHRYRFIGVHLKSKREVRDVDEEEMRVHEARLLRRHVDAIIAADEQARLVVYGDFNDTRKSMAWTTVTGNYGSSVYLTAIPAKDSRGESWTHYWDYQDIYSRIDFISVSQALKREVDFAKSYIVEDAGWNRGSDHRALVAIFKSL